MATQRTQANDENTTIGELRRQLAEFTAARQWNTLHTPRSLAMSIVIEAAELMEHYQWVESPPADEPFAQKQLRAEVGEELADIVIYCLHFANATGTDLTQVLLDKLARNEKRFPAEKMREKLPPDSKS